MGTDNNKSLLRGMKCAGIISGVFAVVTLILFLLNQTYDVRMPINNGIFGTYGDFIGGVLGTGIGFYTVYLLVKTFENQSSINNDIAKTNKSIIEANNSTIVANKKAEAASERQYYQIELQLFDGKFKSFLDAYQTAINNYSYKGFSGRIAFEKIANEFIGNEFKNNNVYRRRSNSATDEYLLVYAEHQTMMSVHLRMLYLLVSLISNSELEETDKVQYAKLVRGQMSSMEMLIVRYNCLSLYGEKMRKFCNEYNLIKHLPIMNLLEFNVYKSIISEGKDSDKMISGLNAMFITLRKLATTILYDNGNKLSEIYETSHSYKIAMSCSTDRKNFLFSLIKDKTKERRGDGVRICPEEKALDCLKEINMIKNIFLDFLREIFYTSNFKIYNKEVDIKKSYTNDNDKEYSFYFQVSSKNKLALSFLQYKSIENLDSILES